MTHLPAEPPQGRPVVDCSATLLRLYEYIDGEMIADDGAGIQAHLDDCVECLRHYRMEVAVKAAVKRACGCEAAPESLRQAILTRISVTSIRIETIEY